MQQMRFQTQNVFVLQKTVQFCGKNIARSKKRVKWVVKQGGDVHNITCALSFYSGKKKVTHNGHVIINIINDRPCLDFIVVLGLQRMIFMVDEESQEAKIETKYMSDNDQFCNFKNVFSQQTAKVFEKVFGSE